MEKCCDPKTRVIKDCMKSIIQKYCEIRVLAREEIAVFWDAIVITTADEEQTKAYRYQLQKKQERREIPQNLPIYLFSDPPGTKIGSGGSILYSLDQLFSKLGDELFRMRVFFICAGGKSQRLPTASVLGKLFLPLPIGDSLFHMLDLKIAMYLPFVQRMKAGVFVTCSDDVETYFLPTDNASNDYWSFEGDGFTALGIMSSIEIGKNHGVYVLPERIEDNGKYVNQSNCLEVLQKPSLQTMKERKAILKDDTVCTDSIFFFDHGITAKFLNYMKQCGEVSCEIDAYGDFLQPLGTSSSLSYVTNVSNVVNATSSLAVTRERLFHVLRGTPLHIVILCNSRFYHLGTMGEYIDNVASGKSSLFFEELNCNPFAFSRLVDVPSSDHDNRDHRQGSCAVPDFLMRNAEITVMHSVIDSGVEIGSQTIVEYCHVKSPCRVGARCILSNCQISPADVNHPILVPPKCCFHTVALHVEGQLQFVTLVFGINDDLKQQSSADHWERELTYLSVSFQRVCDILGCDQLFPKGCDSYSLWNAKLFPLAESMRESFLLTNDMACHILNGNSRADSQHESSPASRCRVSMAEILKLKNVEKMLEFQEGLRRMVLEI